MLPGDSTELQTTLSLLSRLKEQLESQLTAGGTPPKSSNAMSLPAICALYFSENPRKVGAATIARDRISANNLCRLIPSALVPDEIDQPAVIHYRNAREAEGAAPRTILGEMTFLKMVLHFGVAWHRVTGVQSTVFLAIPDVGEWEDPGVALSVDEFREVLQGLSPINRRRFVVGVTTMLRRTPLLALSTAWVDLETNWLSVPVSS